MVCLKVCLFRDEKLMKYLRSFSSSVIHYDINIILLHRTIYFCYYHFVTCIKILNATMRINDLNYCSI